MIMKHFIIQLMHSIKYVDTINPLTPNDDYSGRTAPLTSKRCILYIYSTNTGTEYFKHSIYSPFFPLQNAVCFINLTYLVPVLFTFYIQGVLKLKKNNSGAKRLTYTKYAFLSFVPFFDLYLFLRVRDVLLSIIIDNRTSRTRRNYRLSDSQPTLFSRFSFVPQNAVTYFHIGYESFLQIFRNL